MKLLGALMCALCVVLVGCAGPHSTGGLWAQQNLDQELAQFRLTDSQRQERAHAYELQLANEALASERERLGAAVQDCPGPAREPLGFSVGDRVRDGIRIWAAGDAAVSTAVAQVAWADWLVRRGRMTGDTRFCDAARAALSGSLPASTRRSGSALGAFDAATPTAVGAPARLEPASSEDPLTRLGVATVARDGGNTRQAPDDADPLTALSLYASGWADVVHAATPLPQYLAAVYGGVVVDNTPVVALPTDVSPEAIVDRAAPDHPEWEPDALFAALTSSAP